MRLTREAVGVAAMVALVFAVYAWSAGFWIDPVDEGYFLDLADRVLHGQLPYRDFATYYTPGVFYLFALCLKLFGISMLSVRFLMAGLHAVCALLLYGLTRRVAPWPLALLPFTVVAALDHWPIEPEPHPSWPAIVLCLLTMEMVSRHVASARARWLALAGLSAGLAFLFKQNIGAFTAIGLAGYIVLRPRLAAGRLLRATQIVFAAGAGAAITVLIWPALDPLMAGALWLPPLLTLALLVYRAPHAKEDAPWAAALAEPIKEGALAGGVFLVVTAAWLIPLLIAIGPSQVPIGLFLGSIDQTGIATPLDAFTVGTPALAVVAIWLPTALVASGRGRSRWRLVGAGVALTVFSTVLPLWHGPRDVLTEDPQLAAWLRQLDVNFGTLHLYLPALAAWAGLVALVRQPVGLPGWYLLFGVLAALTMYPRADTAHALVASPPVLVAGAWAIGRVYCLVRTTPTWRHLSVTASLLIVPVAALAPQLLWRYAVIIAPEEPGVRLDYQSLGLTRAPVLVPRHQAEDVRGVVEYVQAGTPPGAPFFAYPVVPLFNFLADRPNPTRFDHFLPGTLTNHDFAEIIDDLQRRRPRYVLWDHLGVLAWATDLPNRPLSDYLWRCYHEVTAFHLYLVLERTADDC
jgi:hypothetical protein